MIGHFIGFNAAIMAAAVEEQDFQMRVAAAKEAGLPSPERPVCMPIEIEPPKKEDNTAFKVLAAFLFGLSL